MLVVAGTGTGKTVAIPKLLAHYFGYKKKNPFSHLIYPVTSKNPNSLGIHATIDLGGQLKFGPDIEYVSIESYDVVESKKEIFVQL